MRGDPGIFLDTAGLLSVLHRRDQYHAQASSVLSVIEGDRTPVVTSQWVFAELLASVSRSAARQSAVSFVRLLSRHSRASVEQANDFEPAFSLYAQRTDKSWSLVDCASILLCRRRGITRVFTHDRHFAQAGLEILL